MFDVRQLFRGFGFGDLLSLCRRADAADPTLDAVLLHCLNHCTKVADRIKRGNEAVRSGLEGKEAPRDQGFTRPKVRPRPSRSKVYDFSALSFMTNMISSI